VRRGSDEDRVGRAIAWPDSKRRCAKRNDNHLFA
jgi:hypothetical protein